MIMSYKNFLSLLKEGLIRTHDINRYERVLTDYIDNLNIKYSINIVDKLKFYVVLYTNNLDVIECVNHQSFTLGYFPSEYRITLNSGMVNKFKSLENYKLNNVSLVEISYEAKYEDGLYTNDIICPDKLYHLTNSNNWNSIQKFGLYPKSKNRISIHPDRIYLFDDIDNADILLKNLKLSDIINGKKCKYDLLEIDLKNHKLILHTDPNYRLGYFTYDNISPKLIRRISI